MSNGKLVPTTADEHISTQWDDDLEFYEISDTAKNVSAKAAVVGCCPYGFREIAMEATLAFADVGWMMVKFSTSSLDS